MDKSKPFCVMPYVHSSTTNNGDFRVCCHSFIPIGKYNINTHTIQEVWNSDEYNEIRKTLNLGDFPAHCTHCKNLESKGIYSPRNLNNTTHDITLESIPVLPYDIDLKIGTQCNLKCITCYPGASNQHQKEVDNWKSQKIEIPLAFKKWDGILQTFGMDPYTFDKSFDAINAFNSLKECFKSKTHLSIVGGEPLINTNVINFLELCIANNLQDNVILTIITNLTSIDTKIFKFLNQFPTTLYVSFDHIDPKKFNYIRYPAQFENFIQNFNQLFEYKNITVKLSTTWSIFNIVDIIDIISYWEEIRIKYSVKLHLQINIVEEPSYFSIKYLPKITKVDLAEKISKFLKFQNLQILTESPTAVEQLHGIVSALLSEPEDYQEITKEQQRVLQLYDSTRGTDYITLFPHINI